MSRKLERLLDKKEELTRRLSEAILKARDHYRAASAIRRKLQEVERRINELLDEMDIWNIRGRPPDPNSRTARIRRLLDSKPDRAWSAEDVALKLDDDARGVSSTLSRMKRDGLIQRVGLGRYSSLKSGS